MINGRFPAIPIIKNRVKKGRAYLENEKRGRRYEVGKRMKKSMRVAYIPQEWGRWRNAKIVVTNSKTVTPKSNTTVGVPARGPMLKKTA